jgi:hypothetical protein
MPGARPVTLSEAKWPAKKLSSGLEPAGQDELPHRRASAAPPAGAVLGIHEDSRSM